MSTTTHYSHSQLSEYARCGKSYQLRRRQNAPTTMSWWLVGGSAVHLAIERYNLSLVDAAEWGEVGDEWYRAFDEVLSREVERHPDKDSWRSAGRAGAEQKEDWWRINGMSMVTSWVDFVEGNDWKPAVFDGIPAVEFDVTGEFGGSTVKGFVDLAAVTPDGELILIDFKTGSRPVSTTQQLGMYSCAMERLGMPRPSLGAYFMNRKGAFGAFHSLDRYTGEYFDAVFSSLRTSIDSNIFLPSVGDHCRICDVADACFANGGSKSAHFDPSDPHYTKKEGSA